jgi:hypothetical protein
MNEVSQLVGYMRRANAGASIKISINKKAFENCNAYTTSDGQTYIPLVVSLSALRKVIQGERAVTTISQIVEELE